MFRNKSLAFDGVITSSCYVEAILEKVPTDLMRLHKFAQTLIDNSIQILLITSTCVNITKDPNDLLTKEEMDENFKEEFF